MKLNKEQMEKLSQAYNISTNSAFAWGFIATLEALGVKQEQIDEITG